MKLFSFIRIYFSKEKKYYQIIKNVFGFYPENIFLYKQAFRHKSVSKEIRNGVKDSNERLEYLGDAVLGSIIADYLFKQFPYRDEGFLTEMRSKLVNRSQLNKLSEKIGLKDMVMSDKDSINYNTSIYGDAFEALIGAIYIDKGYTFTKKVVLNKIIHSYFDIHELETTEFNYKSKLIEWAQKEKKNIQFKVVAPSETVNSKMHFVKIYIDQTLFGEGVGTSIKIAEKNASKDAWNKMNLDHSG